MNVNQLISEQIPQAQAQKAYRILTDDPSKMALILKYPTQEPKLESVVAVEAKPSKPLVKVPQVVAGLIGAGNFAKLTLLPAIKPVGIRLKTVADINGVSGKHAASKFGFEQATNNYKNILEDDEINTVFITTRHDLHAKMVIEALEAGKNVHVEKPLCLNREDIGKIKDVYRKVEGRQLLVGFNRRFSPHAQKIRSLMSTRTTPVCMSWLINAGYIPADVWVQNRTIGGGRNHRRRLPLA